MKLSHLILLTALTVLAICLAQSRAAPSRASDYGNDARESRTLAKWMLRQIEDFQRDRRAKLDAGFLSRHSPVEKMLKSTKARKQAQDAYGPGRRK